MLRQTALVTALVALSLVAFASGDRGFYQNAREAAQAAGASPRGIRPDVQALAANEVFNTIQIATNTGALSVALASDEVGDGVVAVYRPAVPVSSVRAVMGVTDLGAGGMLLFDRNGLVSYILDGDDGLQTVSGDVAEAFPAREEELTPGAVMVIDPERPGTLRLARQAYDRRVAGVLAGARDYKPGVTLGGLGRPDAKARITLSGTVYCSATNVNGAIRVGDLLTTSAVPGHAMKATDADASRGAILGKAMEDLREDRGQILILASLQ